MTSRHLFTTVMLASALSLATVLAQPSSQLAKLMASADHKATVDGDLKGAIEDYKQVVASAASNRPLAAQALLKMAEAYQKLGNAEAQRAYERLVRDFSDQTELAAVARARLPVTSRAHATHEDRVVKAGNNITWGEGRVSLDGRYISYVDWNFTGNLILHDLMTGTDRPLTTNKDFSVGNGASSTFSPDGKQIAFGWRTYGQNVPGKPNSPHINELRVLSLDAVGVPQPRRVIGSADVAYYNPMDWSPDGKSLATVISRDDGTRQIALIDVQDGALKVMKTVGWRGPNRIFFSPDGRFIAYDLPTSEDRAQRDVFVMPVDATRESLIAAHPADDVVIGWPEKDGRLYFASDRTGTVALWAVPVMSGKPQGTAVMIKPNIGSVNTQGFTRSGVLHLVKDASTVSLQVAPIDLAAGNLTGAPTLENFRSDRPDWSRDGKWIAYKSTSVNGLQMLSLRSRETGQLQSVPVGLQYLAEPRFMPDAASVIAAGRDLRGRGGIFRIDVRSGRTAQLVHLDGNTGRPQVSPDGNKIYYAVGGSSLRSAVPAEIELNLTTGDTREVFRRTNNMQAAELSPDGKYMAVVVGQPSNQTTLNLYPVDGSSPRELMQIKAPNAVHGYGGVSWTPDSSAVVAMVATADKSEPRELWLVPVDGNKPRKLAIDPTKWAGAGIRLSSNGKEIAFKIGDDSREVWAIGSIMPTAPAAQR